MIKHPGRQQHSGGKDFPGLAFQVRVQDSEKSGQKLKEEATSHPPSTVANYPLVLIQLSPVLQFGTHSLDICTVDPGWVFLHQSTIETVTTGQPDPDVSLRGSSPWAGEMSRWLEVLTALAEDLSLGSSSLW